MRLFSSKKQNTGHVCDSCGTTVKVQVVDLVQGVDVLHCPVCRTRWQVEHRRPEVAKA